MKIDKKLWDSLSKKERYHILKRIVDVPTARDSRGLKFATADKRFNIKKLEYGLLEQAGEISSDNGRVRVITPRGKRKRPAKPFVKSFMVKRKSTGKVMRIGLIKAPVKFTAKDKKNFYAKQKQSILLSLGFHSRHAEVMRYWKWDRFKDAILNNRLPELEKMKGARKVKFRDAYVREWNDFSVKSSKEFKDTPQYREFPPELQAMAESINLEWNETHKERIKNETALEKNKNDSYGYAVVWHWYIQGGDLEYWTKTIQPDAYVPDMYKDTRTQNNENKSNKTIREDIF